MSHPFAFTIDVNHHFPSSPDDLRIRETILSHLVAIKQQGVHIMSKMDDLEAELVTANDTTNEIASDLDALIAQSVKPGLSEAEADQLKADIQAFNTRLRGVADKYTAPTP